MKTLVTIAKHLIFVVLYVIGFYLFILIVGEETPDSQYTFFGFLAMKGAAFLGAYLLYLVCRLLYRKGMLPDYIAEEIERDGASGEEGYESKETEG